MYTHTSTAYRMEATLRRAVEKDGVSISRNDAAQAFFTYWYIFSPKKDKKKTTLAVLRDRNAPQRWSSTESARNNNTSIMQCRLDHTQPNLRERTLHQVLKKKTEVRKIYLYGTCSSFDTSVNNMRRNKFTKNLRRKHLWG